MNKALVEALRVAATSRGRHKHGAVVVRRGKTVAAEVNRTTSDARFSNRPICSIHAELAAILAAGSLARGATLYVARVNRQGEPRDSAPCKKCRGFIQRSGIVRVVHT